jgi:hypothetical protein
MDRLRLGSDRLDLNTITASQHEGNSSGKIRVFSFLFSWLGASEKQAQAHNITAIS